VSIRLSAIRQNTDLGWPRVRQQRVAQLECHSSKKARIVSGTHRWTGPVLERMGSEDSGEPSQILGIDAGCPSEMTG